MKNFHILTEASPWFILLCLLAGAGYAWLLYSKKGPWNTSTKRTLLTMRFVLASTLFFLLMAPFLKLVKNYFEKPALVIALDNSQSIPLATDSLKLMQLKSQLKAFIATMDKENLKVEIQTFGKTTKNPEDISFSSKTTDLHKLLSTINDNYENRNLAGILLISDGIFNEGLDPLYEQYPIPLYSVGLGDTTEKKDLKVSSLRYNKIVYAGNKFPIQAEFENKGFAGKVKIYLKKGKQTIEQKTITLDENKKFIQTTFLVNPEKAGLQHYTVGASVLPGDFSSENNIAHAYVKVIQGKENVLIVAFTPHPDIKAIRAALEKKENYDVEVYIPGINELKKRKNDLIIFHQFPSLYNSKPALVKQLMQASKGRFFILGNQTNIQQFNQINPALTIQTSNQKDFVTAALNPHFEKFRINPEQEKIINTYPPVSVPFGNYSIRGNTDVIFYQKIGSTVSETPLLLTTTKDENKTAIFTGDGLWLWRLNEYQKTKNTEVFDNLITSLVQYLSSKEDKRKFKVYPVKNEFKESDKIVFESELYNDVYERVYDKKITLNIKNEAGGIKQYAFTPTEANTQFEVKGLNPGLYSYTASTKYEAKTESVSGQFAIRRVMLEAMNTTANFNLLRELSKKSGGDFVTLDNFSKLPELIKPTEKKSIIHSNEEYQELINLPWLFAFLLLLVSLEWGIRKYSGGY